MPLVMCRRGGGKQPLEPTPGTARRRLRWAELIRRVYEADPLLCPKCNATMRIISFIEKRDQAATIDLPAVPAPTALPLALQAGKILRHCGLWVDPPAARAPPTIQYTPAIQLELLYDSSG